ncbi:papain-like cysteine protease family protein [Bifidobacterium parmae]|uniref:papain-like cysteine protease family protein n=1 Tax=Bifidobacterium parmae TaxID=361854 RepID=UPI003C2F73F9
MPIVQQAKSNWCWVAVSKSLSLYFGGVNDTQCQYYRWGKTSSDCPNETGDFYHVGKAMAGGGVVNRGTIVQRALTQDEIMNGIRHNSPMLMRWGWKTSTSSEESGGFTGGHMMVISGYQYDPNFFVVAYMDPLLPYMTSALYENVVEDQRHVWTHSRYGMGG